MIKTASATLAAMATLMFSSVGPANAAANSDHIITKCDGVVAGFTCGSKDAKTEIKIVKNGEGIAGGDKAVMVLFPGGHNAAKCSAGMTVSNLIPPKQAVVLGALEVKMSGTMPNYKIFSRALARKAKGGETYVVDGKHEGTGNGGYQKFTFHIPSPDTLVAATVWGESTGGRMTQTSVMFEDVRAEYIGKGKEFVIPTDVKTRNDGCDAKNPK